MKKGEHNLKTYRANALFQIIQGPGRFCYKNNNINRVFGYATQGIIYSSADSVAINGTIGYFFPDDNRVPTVSEIIFAVF